jgi:hypothetical protein
MRRAAPRRRQLNQSLERLGEIADTAHSAHLRFREERRTRELQRAAAFASAGGGRGA